MPLVKMKTIYAGPSGCAQPGSKIQVSEKEAKELVAGGYAVLVEAKGKPADVETAKAPDADVETAKAPKPDSGGRGKGKGDAETAKPPKPDKPSRGKGKTGKS